MTQVADELAELHSGKITLEQLGTLWAARTWSPVPQAPRDPVGMAAWEPCDSFGGDGTWDEVVRRQVMGELSWNDYLALSRIVYDAKKSNMVQARKILADYSDDEPRDDGGKWTSGCGDGGGGSGAAVTPLSQTDRNGATDAAVAAAVEKNQRTPQYAKSLVVKDITTRMGSKYDAQLITGNYTAMGDYPAPGTPVDQLLGHNSIWTNANSDKPDGGRR
jgi:hypothetical protein